MDIKVDHVTKTFGSETVLEDVCLDLHGGTIYGLRGKNGSGKTMLLRALCGLIVPTHGAVVIDGKPLHKEGRSFPASVGVLIEEPGCIRSHSGLRYLKEVAAIRGIATESDITELMLRLALDPLDRKPIRKYSLGMRQKIGIVAALMEKPELILLDEPLNALDEASVGIVADLLREARDRGALVVVASHDKEELDALADVVIGVKSGHVMAPNVAREAHMPSQVLRGRHYAQ